MPKWKCPACLVKNHTNVDVCRVCNYTRVWICSCGIKRPVHIHTCAWCREGGDVAIQASERVARENELTLESALTENYHLKRDVGVLTADLKRVRKLLGVDPVELKREVAPEAPKDSSSLVKTCQLLWESEKTIVALRRKIRDLTECPVCLEHPKDTAAKCGHRACHRCFERMPECPVCREPVKEVFRVYL